MGICRLAEQGARGGDCAAGPLGISVRDPLFQGRYHVPLTIPLAPASVILQPGWLAAWPPGRPFVPLHPIPNPTSTTTAQVSGPEQSRPALPRRATRSARTHPHSVLVRASNVVLEADHMHAVGPGVCALSPAASASKPWSGRCKSQLHATPEPTEIPITVPNTAQQHRR